MKTSTLTGTAILLAIALLSQSIRNIMPLHGMSQFLIGSLVGACTAIAVWRYGLKSGILIAIVTPMVAYMQGMLTIPVFVPIVMIGGMAYAVVMDYMERRALWATAAAGAIVKCIVLYGLFSFLFMVDHTIPAPMQKGVLFSMGWPQLVTGACGVWLARVLHKRLSY